MGSKRIIVDSSFPEETRVAFVNGTDIEHFEVDTSSSKKQLKGNIYLAKVGRVEPSLQSAFVDFGGNKQGFLPFNEINDSLTITWYWMNNQTADIPLFNISECSIAFCAKDNVKKYAK